MIMPKDNRTRAQREADDRDSVRANLEQLGPHGALLFARRELTVTAPGHVQKRRILCLTVFAAAEALERDCRNARMLARCHRQGLKQAGLWVA